MVDTVAARSAILVTALEAREQEVLHYQINIDNYTLALERIAAMSAQEQSDLSAFKDQLQSLLASEKAEQKKAQIMLDVIRSQVG